MPRRPAVHPRSWTTTRFSLTWLIAAVTHWRERLLIWISSVKSIQMPLLSRTTTLAGRASFQVTTWIQWGRHSSSSSRFGCKSRRKYQRLIWSGRPMRTTWGAKSQECVHRCTSTCLDPSSTTQTFSKWALVIFYHSNRAMNREEFTESLHLCPQKTPKYRLKSRSRSNCCKLICRRRSR